MSQSKLMTNKIKYALFLIPVIWGLLYFFFFNATNYIGASDDFLTLMKNDIPPWSRFWRFYTQANGRTGSLILLSISSLYSKLFNLNPFEMPWKYLYLISFLLPGWAVTLCYLTISSFLKRSLSILDLLLFSLLFFLTVGCPWVLRDYFQWYVMLPDYGAPFFLLFFTLYYHQEIKEKWGLNLKGRTFAQSLVIFLAVFFSASGNENTLGIWGGLIVMMLIYHYRVVSNSIKSSFLYFSPHIMGTLLALLGYLLSPGQWYRKMGTMPTTVKPLGLENFIMPFLYTPSKVALAFFTFDGIAESKKYFILPGVLLSVLLIWYYLRPKKINRYLMLFVALQALSFMAAWTRLFSSYYPQRVAFLSGFLYTISYVVLVFYFFDSLEKNILKIRWVRSLTLLSLSALLIYFTSLRLGDDLSTLAKLSARGQERFLLLQQISQHEKNNKKLYFHNCPEQLESIWGLENFERWMEIGKTGASVVIDDISYFNSGMHDRTVLDFAHYEVKECPSYRPQFHRRNINGEIFPVVDLVDYQELVPKATYQYLIDQLMAEGGQCHFSLQKEEVYNSVPTLEELVGIDLKIEKREDIRLLSNITRKREDMMNSNLSITLTKNGENLDTIPKEYKKTDELLFPKVWPVNDDTIKLNISVDKLIVEKPLHALRTSMKCTGSNENNHEGNIL